MLDNELEKNLHTAFEIAQKQRHEYITVECLLYALLDNSEVRHVLKKCAVNLKQITSDLEAYLDQNVPIVSIDDDLQTQTTLGFQRVIQRAVFYVQATTNNMVRGINVLIAMFEEKDSFAVYLLRQHNINNDDIINYISHDIAVPNEIEFSPDEEVGGNQQKLPLFVTNLNEKALNGKIDPLIGREKEIERSIQVLGRRKKNNPLYVGEPGVGKTAVAEGLALKITCGKVPDIIKDATIYALNLGSLIAGTKYRGDFEKRFNLLISTLKEEANTILFIDEIHMLIGAGAAAGNTMDASNLLKPLLSSNELRCIGSTTYEEYRNIFEKDKALARRFQKMDIEEPTEEETYLILKGLQGSYEKFHQVKYSAKTLLAAVDLSVKHIHDRALPDKAIDVIDEAGAWSRTYHKIDKSGKWRTIRISDIEQVVANMAHVPPRHIKADELQILEKLEDRLKLVVFGQNEAIQRMVASIKLSRSGLRENRKPVGSFLFAGPTGVGKTEISQQLAQINGIQLHRFDMSEYRESHSISRLIGAPPGYVGYEKGGLLTDAVSKNPHAVILLDEIEKAHPDIFNLLLQIMDNGTLTDANGRKIDFCNTIVIMTSNAGSSEMSRASIGFTTTETNLKGYTADTVKAINRIFTPEFRNRLDAVVIFRPLETKVILSIVDKFIVQFQAHLNAKKIQLTVDDQVRQWLADKGFDSTMGARPLQRLIDRKLKQVLLDEILFGKLKRGGHVAFYMGNNDNPAFTITENTKIKTSVRA